jgi:N6-L-threonylcarbamoyladenine synthase
MVLVLGLESTCDETGCSIVRDGREILSNVVSSQINLHSEYGGVVPELACRRHIDVIIPVIRQALEEAQLSLDDIDAIAVAKGPGLIGALLIGLNAAKALAFSIDKPLIGVNHIEAHIYAATMDHSNSMKFPCLGVIISGGHTAIIKIDALGQYTLLGHTVDDAIGEAFDKVAAMLNLPYPGGPNIERLAKNGDLTRYAFKAGRVKGKPLHFSFSGLKTSVLYTIKGQNTDKNSPLTISEEDKPDVAASFQHAAISDIVKKAKLASESFDCHSIILGGGVSNNQYLRKIFDKQNLPIPILWPPQGLSLDNAAMIAGLGYHQFINNKDGDPLDIQAMTRIPL